MVDRLLARPHEQWRRITLTNIGRIYRTPRILDDTVRIRDDPAEIRQIAITDLGRQKSTLLITIQMTKPAAQRMVIENTIADAIDFFHMDALSAAMPIKINLDVQLTIMASALYCILAKRVGHGHDTAKSDPSSETSSTLAPPSRSPPPTSSSSLDGAPTILS